MRYILASQSDKGDINISVFLTGMEILGKDLNAFVKNDQKWNDRQWHYILLFLNRKNPAIEMARLNDVGCAGRTEPWQNTDMWVFVCARIQIKLSPNWENSMWLMPTHISTKSFVTYRV